MALAVASLSITLTLSKACKPIRDIGKEFGPWVGKLFNCPYCMSHWLAAGVVTYRKPFDADFILIVFATITLSSVASGGIVWLLLLLGEE